VLRTERSKRATGKLHAAVLAALLLVSSVDRVQAQDTNVPARMQAQLISKVPAYDRGFRERAGARVVVLILIKSGKSESVRAASLLQAALAQEHDIAGLPHETALVPFTSPAALAAESKRRSASIVYVSSGFDGELDAICAAMQPLGVMTVTAVPDYVRRCVVLGFEAAAGKPKLLIHLEQAKKSGIRFKSEILKLAKVYR
jgi:hypothetical protein